MDIKHSTGEVAIASVKGYLWFLCLNIIFAAWLLVRILSGDSVTFDTQHYMLPLWSIIGFSLINLFSTLTLRDGINEGLYQKCLPFIVLIFSVLWSIIFFNMLTDFKQPTITMVILVLSLIHI